MTAISSSGLGSMEPGLLQSGMEGPRLNAAASQHELKEAFTDFVGQTFFGQLIASMRKTVEKPAYFHGGRAEEVFQGQLDQLLTDKVAEASSEQFAEPMYELFTLQRPAG